MCRPNCLETCHHDRFKLGWYVSDHCSYCTYCFGKNTLSSNGLFFSSFFGAKDGTQGLALAKYFVIESYPISVLVFAERNIQIHLWEDVQHLYWPENCSSNQGKCHCASIAWLWWKDVEVTRVSNCMGKLESSCTAEHREVIQPS